MKNKNIYIYVLLSLVFLAIVIIAMFIVKTEGLTYIPYHKKNDSKTENAGCLKCHGTRHFKMAKPSNPKIVIHSKMPRECIIDTNLFYTSSHWNFSCIDCHSEEYKTAPHDPNLQFESISTCIDCHDETSDTTWSKFKFTTIETEYNKSIHAKKCGNSFNCYTCHNPHSTKMGLRNDSLPLNQVVAVSNEMCTKCHAIDKPNMQHAHHRIPHTEIHLQKNRCIDCHSSTNDTILVAHDITDKKLATRNCSECHSANSKIDKDLTSKRQNEICSMMQKGAIGKKNSSQTRLLGVYRNPFLTYSLVTIFSILLLAIIFHLIWSLKQKSKIVGTDKNIN